MQAVRAAGTAYMPTSLTLCVLSTAIEPFGRSEGTYGYAVVGYVQLRVNFSITNYMIRRGSMFARKLTTASAVALFALGSVVAQAANVQVTCEKRPDRSRASVDGNNLKPGMYRAILKSGTDHIARSQFEQTVRGEVQFDFDSNQGDVAAGATPIGIRFIVNGRVRGYLVNENFQRVTPIVEVQCRIVH